MKKLFAAVALIMGMGASVALADNTTCFMLQTVNVAKDYTQIELRHIPQAITDTIAKNYKGNTIKEAYVKTAEDETKTYKIILIDGEDTETIVFFNDKGEEVKEVEE